MAIFGKIMPDPFTLINFNICTSNLALFHCELNQIVVIIPNAALVQIYLFCVYLIFSTSCGIFTLILSVEIFLQLYQCSQKLFYWVLFFLVSLITFSERLYDNSSAISFKPYNLFQLRHLHFLYLLITR